MTALATTRRAPSLPRRFIDVTGDAVRVYGEEIGKTGDKPDERLRTPMAVK